MNSQRTTRAQERGSGTRAVPSGYLVARFIRFYGMATWTHRSYPTRDHIIPFQLFFAYLASMPGIVASEQLDSYYAALLAGAMVHGSEEGHAKRARLLEQLVGHAYPTAHAHAPKTVTQ